MADKKNKKKRAPLSIRMNILFFAIFLLFSALVLQLGVVQILNGESYQDEIQRTNLDTTNVPVPRGKIYDTNGELIVDNEAMYSITYTPSNDVQAEERLEVAEKLAQYIDMGDEQTIDRITDRDRREYYLLHHEEEIEERLETVNTEEMENSEVYDATLELITDEEISDFTDDELEIIAIKKELDSAYALTPQVVKNEDVTAEEYAAVAENLDELPGINASTDWDRVYPNGDTLTSILGNVSSQEEGIPEEDLNAYLTMGYSRNDRVGTSGLEEQYEDFLRGRKEQIQYTTRQNGSIIGSETIVDGERGKDLVLTTDLEFQQEVDDILLDEFQSMKASSPYENRFATNAYAVVMNPKTGELLATSGVEYDTENDEYNNNAGFTALANAHEPGSSIKGATILAGYDSEVISPGETFNDAPMRLAGSEVKRSVQDMGTVNDLTALERSSNVYMFYVALRLGGDYRHPMPRNANLDINMGETLQTLQNYFNQFGLGSTTGVDFPYESTGLRGQVPDNPGNLLDFVIGQYDTYTTMQLAQYVSTIANDGYRVQPHFLKEARDPVASMDELGPLYYSSNTTTMNRIEMTDDEISRVQDGFRLSYQGSQGTGNDYFDDKSYNPAGKTGTAESAEFVDGERFDLNNLTLVGYAPFDDPEIAFAVVVPHVGIGEGDQINLKVGERVLDSYFEVKEDHDEEAEDSDGDSDNEEEE
ncbi:penicillin-binding protein [Oceanobacillus oncorhynchi subsp. incaldanensis]|uniref:peptidoglycan D,D-transpeptidase FtsI family protein n=1 Tax=Oceanobacillus oncorhynchi TaxID=545501 RepID=UPI001B0DBFEA|nr:penicillin-binding protein 2 [Oceanobacillus oncorhynchi]GIO17418.1 penicillin-binding protein [Oceanobacillus oncorhynchi subsp. incaldanensis]